MLSAIAIVKIAVEICNSPELKKGILYRSEDLSDQYNRVIQWNEIVKRKGISILNNLGLPQKLQENVMGIVSLVGMKMRIWAEYHERTLGFSREYSIEFLNSSFFTQQGIIDNKKAAEGLMNDKHLSIEQKYKLACIYCFTDHIPDLYRQMTKEDQEKFYSTRPHSIKQSELARFWSYYLMGEVDKIKGEKSLDQYRLEKSVESGSKAAVEYCLEKTDLRRKKDCVVYAAVETLRNGILLKNYWMVFQNRRYDDSKESWVPCDYYYDILCFLMSKMAEVDQIEFLKKDIEGVGYKMQPFKEHRRSRVLEYLLNWPYQGYFMKTAELMWEFLPESAYAILLLKVCDKIGSRSLNILNYKEENSYDYRELLKEFWSQSPERYKRYLFSNQRITNCSEKAVIILLLIKLLTLQNFTREDKENIRLILASATDNEKKNICSKEGKNICIRLMKEEKWIILDVFVLNCFPSKDQANEFKRELIHTEEAQDVCIDFGKNCKWNTVASFMKWCSLPEEDVNQFKKDMIYSKDGKTACLYLIQCDELGEDIDRYIRWHISSEGEVKTFKKELIFSDIGAYECANIVLEHKLDLVNEFINFCLSSEKEIRELKKNVAYKAYLIFEGLILKYEEDDEWDNTIDRTTKFKRRRWEEVEILLTWCFSSEEEMREFKKHVLLEKSGAKIHFELIYSNHWEEAEFFFAWLGLSAEEIQKLKKDTLFHHDAASEMFCKLMFLEECWGHFVDFGSKQEAIELFLRWYLTDKETVLEFKDEFKRRNYCYVYYGKGELEPREDVFANFDWRIEQRLKDLDKEKMNVKRKSETFSPNKRLCNLNL